MGSEHNQRVSRSHTPNQQDIQKMAVTGTMDSDIGSCACKQLCSVIRPFNLMRTCTGLIPEAGREVSRFGQKIKPIERQLDPRLAA